LPPLRNTTGFLREKSGFYSGSYSCRGPTISAYTDAIEAPAKSHLLTNGGIEMNKIALLMAAILMVGCTSLNDGSYMPGVSQEEQQNPHLLNCGGGGKVCKTSSGRVHKSYHMCRCL
jgi:hypothetical protein